MIRLHYANRLENLIAPLADAIAAQQRARPLDRVTIVVPSRVIENFIKHRVSETIGIAANLDFPFLRRFLAGILEKADPKLRILDVQELELVLFESLRLATRERSREWSVPIAYIEQGEPAEKEKERRTLHLARQLALLFREYSITRRAMLQNWTRPDYAAAEQLSETERWQQQLWKSIFGSNSCLRSEWKADDSESDWRLLADAFETIATPRLKVALPPVVHVFGLAYAGPAYLRIFSQLGKLIDLNIYALNPCREFWEDVEHLPRAERESWTRRHSKVGDLDRSSDPFGLDAASDTPALRLWARPGREFIRMLNEATECDFDAHFTAPNPGRTLLGNLQEDILNRAPERQPVESGFLHDDGSIRFLACPGLARETEIVANEIWSMLENDTPGRHAPRFHQIGVIVPDALYQDYLPHLESAFSRLHRLPMNVVDRGLGSESAVLEAILLLLHLPLGRFSRDEMLHLLNHPVIRGEEAKVETDQVGRWCAELGIFFGADADDLADTYIPADTYHWDQGIRRLALGVFLGEERNPEPQFYRGPESIEYLPYETAQEEIPAVAAFVRNARRLLSDATEIRSRTMTLPQWSRLLSDLIVTFIRVDDPADERMLERCVEAVGSIADQQLRSTPVSYQIAYDMICARLADAESQPVQFSEQGIAVGPLSALRAIPFRAIFLLGLNETQFPERDRRDPMDLRLARRTTGDVTPTERDRYLFLETLLAARERICLSYVARDAKSGELLDPSSVVRELQFILRRYVDSPTLDRLTLEHPLSRYDRRYFLDIRPDDSTIGHAFNSYDSEARRGATMAALRADLALHCEGLPLPGRDEPIYQQLTKEAREAMRSALRITEVPLSSEGRSEAGPEISLPIAALRKFLECPLQGAAQYALRIFEDDVEDLEQWQDEPIAQSILERTTLLREVFWEARGNRELLATEYAKAFRISQLAGNAPAGPFEQAAKRVDFESMQHWIDQARCGGCESLDRWHEIRIGRGDESAQAERLIAEVAIPLGTGLAGDTHDRIVRIHGSLGFVSPSGDASLRLVLRDKPKAKDFLGAFLSGIVLAAAGKLDSNQFHAIVVGAGKNTSWSETRSLVRPTVEQARNYLSDLVTDLLFGKNHYFLPIEAVEAVEKEVARGHGGDLLDLIYDLRDNEFARCSSDYGPIRNARRFDPPTFETLRRIMDRRFRLLRAIFAREKG
jgi:exodeoxyribonuclease V gamma subunit